MKYRISSLFPILGFVGSGLFGHPVWGQVGPPGPPDPPPPPATLVWTNIAGGDWNVAANWDLHKVPGPADTAMITNAGTYTVTMTGATEITRLVLGTPTGPGIQTLYYTSGSTFVFPNGPANYHQHGEIDSTGVFNLDLGSVSYQFDTYIVRGTVNWSSGHLVGTIGGSTFGNFTIAPVGRLNILSTNQHALVGANLANSGTVRWTGGTINAGYRGHFQNVGRWVAEGTNQIRDETRSDLQQFERGRFNNSGRFEVTNGVVDFNIGGTHSGTFDIASDSLCRFNAPRGTAETEPNTAGQGVQYGPGIGFGNNTAFTGAGTNLMLSGIYTLDGQIFSQNLEIGRTTVLGDHSLQGIVTMKECSLGRPKSNGASGSFTRIKSQGTLNIRGVLSLTDHTLVNAGKLEWTGGQISLSTGGRVNNQGRWLAREINRIFGGNNQSSFDNQGSFEVETGTTTVECNSQTPPFIGGGSWAVAAGGELRAPPGLGGSLRGSGKLVTPTFTCSGVLRPDALGPGLTIVGDLQQLPGASMEFFLTGTSLPPVRVTGQVQLGGTMSLRTSPEFSPPFGGRYEVLSSDRINPSAISGTFTELNVPAGLSISYGSRSVVLIGPIPSPGQILPPDFAPLGFNFNFSTLSNQIYTVQSATDLANPTWISTTNFQGTGSLLQFATIPGNSPQRYFRVVPVAP